MPMRIADWARSLASDPELARLLTPLRTAEWQSVAPEARAILVAAGFYAEPRKTLIVAASYERALAWQAKLELCGIGRESIRQLPSGSSSLFEDAAPESVALSDRLGALHSLVGQDPVIVIATPQAALERTLPRDVLEEAFVDVKAGATIDPEKLQEQFRNLGYEFQEPVRLPGTFSRRGGILDVFPTGYDLPVRIELFGDEVESLRFFDPGSQRSVGQLPALRLSPSRETLFTGHDPSVRELVLQTMEREASHLEQEEANRLVELVTGDADALAERIYFDRLDLYRPLLHPDSGCAIDLLAEDDRLILDEPLELESLIARSEDDIAEALQARARRGEILASSAHDYILPPDHLASHPRTIAISAMNALPDWLTPAERHDWGAASLEPYRGQAASLADTIKNYGKQGFTIVFATDQPNRAKAVLAGVEIFPAESFGDTTERANASNEGADGFIERSDVLIENSDGSSEGSDARIASANDASKGARGSKERVRSLPESFRSAPGTYLAQGNLGGGFVFTELKLAIVTDAELFGVARLKLPQKKIHDAQPIATVLDLKAGDYVVHIHFGIGIFRGLVKRTEHGVEKEFLFIEYQPPDKLFVPADQLDRIQKYLNPGDAQPKLNKLTGGEWQRTLGKAREEAKEFARDLVKLYAQRKRVQRKPFPSDSPFQREMEQTFPWVETPSQMLAIREVKKDLELPWPLDRLVCGDVGFGKTEVGIRAAFKVVQDGRQVAVLCPTTILSEQHARNFEERLGPFQVRLALLNRYTHASNRTAELKGLKDGTIDIVIGTHALLGKGIEFKHLGLVIIDEEQKFGVKQKEMLKQLRTEVDVLTLSATPIPRTLSMALMDIRQMSLINDPPPGRLPIRTYVRPYAGEVVREAVLRELSRGGQVFYVYNRVESIGHVAEKLRRLVPHARIGVGHGQMSEAELEPIMIGFIKGEIDILLSTTIIENGIDISNANTLIVENADKLGLAQLYQLRGRVGRSDRQAYAYLLYNSGKEITEGAMQRLQALQEFSTLGSGYSLAFRDLQIRGAGELIGAKQSGTMANVGYELYTQLINEAVSILKNSVDGETPAEEIRDPLESLTPLPAFDLPVVALIPEQFIKDQAQRLYYYQRMMSCRTNPALGEVQAEVEDRYGQLTEEVRNAFSIMALRLRARDIGIEKLVASGGRLSVSFVDRSAISPRVFSILGRKNRDCYLTREAFIWPFGGHSVAAVNRMISEFEDSLAQVEAERAMLPG